MKATGPMNPMNTGNYTNDPEWSILKGNSLFIPYYYVDHAWTYILRQHGFVSASYTVHFLIGAKSIGT